MAGPRCSQCTVNPSGAYEPDKSVVWYSHPDKDDEDNGWPPRAYFNLHDECVSCPNCPECIFIAFALGLIACLVGGWWLNKQKFNMGTSSTIANCKQQALCVMEKQLQRTLPSLLLPIAHPN